MPGEDENQAALERAAQTEVDPKLAAMVELLKAEVGEDKAKAARMGRVMNTETIDFEQLARMELARGNRKVDGWKHPLPPPGWRLADDGIGEVNVFYQHRIMGLMVGLSCEREDDGRAYIHLSVSHRSRIPTWGELGKAKEAFLGDLEAYQVLPPRARYVNIDARVLNLYAPLDGPVLPDFTRGTGGI